MSVLFLASTSGAAAARAIGAWVRTLSIQVCMNSWKRSLFGAKVGAGVGAGIRPGARASGPKVGGLMAGFSRQAGGIVESRKRRRSEEQRVTFFTF